MQHQKLMRRLFSVARGYRVICSDLRGYGASSKPPARSDLTNYSFRSMAADQVGLMRLLGHERFHLIGHDRGARVAHRLVLDDPEAVAGITLKDIVPTAALLADLRKGRSRLLALVPPGPGTRIELIDLRPPLPTTRHPFVASPIRPSFA